MVQVCYGFFMASEIAYYTYMYAKVEKDVYQRVTGLARASLLSGRFIASVLAQILVSFAVLDVRELNYISLAGKQRRPSAADESQITIFACFSSRRLTCRRSGPPFSWC